MIALLMTASAATLSRPPILKQKRILIPTIILLVIVAVVGWFASPLFINVTVDEPFPFSDTNEAVVVTSAEFVDLDFIHRGSGNAIVLQSEDKQVLRFEAFRVTNGPDLKVFLVEDINGTDSTTFGDYINLGPLSGNIGDQNYIIPSDVDIAKYAGVVIYCEQFHIMFSTASFDS